MSETFTATIGTSDVSILQGPVLRLIKGELPSGLKHKAIEDAVWTLSGEIDTGGDRVGFFNQTLRGIANATFLKKGGDFWMVEENGEVLAYALASVCEDVDNKLTYHVPQGWVHPKYRRSPLVKQWWFEIRKHAHDCMCQHILIVSARDSKAFCRWFGNGMHPYAVLLKEDL